MIRLSFLRRERYLCLLLLLTGVFFATAFAPSYWILSAPVCLSFLFWTLNRDCGKWALFRRAFSFGFGFGAASTAWIANAILLEGPTGIPLVPLAWIGMGFFFGLFYGIPAALSGFYPIGSKRLLAWAALLTIFEWIRSWFLTGFPWNLTGSIWEDTLPVLQSAAIWGVYGLTFMTISVFSTPALWPNRKPIIIGCACLGLIAALGAIRLYSATNDSVWGIQLRLVQPNIPQTLKWDPAEAEASFAKIRHLSRQNNDAVTHVIWPESAVSFPINQDDEERALMMQAVRQGSLLITGGLRILPNQINGAANSLFVLDDLARILGHYDKSHLVPFGEYVPLRGLLPLDKLVPLAYDFTPGSGVRTLHIQQTPPFGPLVCYEVIFSGRIVDPKDRPSWLVNVTNDGWYGISAGPYQHLGMAKMRAVEEGLPLARAANTGISAVFDGYGRTIGQLDLNTEGVLDTPLPVALPPTPYARFGIILPIGFTIFLLIFLRIRKNNT